MSRRLLLLACLCFAVGLGAAAPGRAEDPPPTGTTTTQAQTVYASGPVVALSVDSLTVGSLRCTVPAEKLSDFSALHLAVGQLVKIACAVSGDRTVLVGIARVETGTSAPQPQTAAGPIVALSVDSITVGSLRCTVPAEKLADFSALRLAVGQLVKIYCAVSGDHTVLLGIARVDGGTNSTEPRTAAGPITAVSSDSITVGSLTCTVPAEKLASVAELHLVVGQVVKISCVASGNHLYLTAIARGDSTSTGPQVRTAEGPIAAVSADSISVGTLTCTVPAEKQSSFADLHLATGSLVKITCVRRGDAWVLTGLARADTAGGDTKHAVRTAKGVVTELTDTSITIKTGERSSLTCAIGPSFDVPGWLHAGSRVGLACRLDGGRLLLVKLRRL
jgi:hypothetical protein